jgi:hypothetical protein
MKFTYRGKRYQRSTLTSKKREAEDLLAFYLGQCARGEFKGFQDYSLSMQKVLDDFERDCKRRKLRGLGIIGYHLKPVRGWFAQMDAEQVRERDISNYIDSRLSAGRRETTVNRELQYLGQALRLAKRRKLLKEIPFIEKFSEKDNARQGFFEDADVERCTLPATLLDIPTVIRSTRPRSQIQIHVPNVRLCKRWLGCLSMRVTIASGTWALHVYPQRTQTLGCPWQH